MTPELVMDGMSLDLKKPGLYRVLVTPEVAAYWLTFRREHQRDINPLNVKRLLKVRADGDWRDDHPDPVFFAVLPDGRESLEQGQHTLSALVAGQFSTLKYVLTGQDPAVYPHLDNSMRRRNFERYRVLETPHANRVFHSAVAAARRVIWHTSARMTVAEIKAWCSAYRDPLERTMEYRSGEHGVGRSIVLAACAEYFAMREGLSDPFLESVYRADGPSQPGRMLRDAILSAPKTGSSLEVCIRCYCLCISAATADFEGRIVKTLRPRDDWPPELLGRMPEAMRDLR